MLAMSAVLEAFATAPGQRQALAKELARVLEDFADLPRNRFPAERLRKRLSRFRP